MPLGDSLAKNLPARAETTGDSGLTPGSERSPGKNGTHSSILAWEILWTEEPDLVQSPG